jgi:hypothetical protein
MKRARIPASDSKALRQLDWQIPSSAMADANLGEVVVGEVVEAVVLGEVVNGLRECP